MLIFQVSVLNRNEFGENTYSSQESSAQNGHMLLLECPSGQKAKLVLTVACMAQVSERTVICLAELQGRMTLMTG